MKMKPVLIFALAVAAGCAAGLAQNTPSSAPAAENASTNAPAGNEVMPLIVIDEAPLPDAIRNLARQANINIQFDPKVLQGQPAPGAKPGEPAMQPLVSFRWENITPYQALKAVLDNYNLQLVQDPTTKISRVTYKDPAQQEPLVAHVIELRYSQPTNVIPLLKASLGPRSQVLSDPRTRQLVVLTTEAEYAKLDDIIFKVDVPPQQVLIEAQFIQTRATPTTRKGIDWGGTLRNHSVQFGNNSAFTKGLEPKLVEDKITSDFKVFTGVKSGVIRDVIPSLIMSTSGGFGPIGFLNSEGLNAVVSFFNEDERSEVMAKPRAVAIEGVPTELSVVRNIPVLEEQQGARTSIGSEPNTVKPNYEVKVGDVIINEVGTKLIVTPRIYGTTNVFLMLKPELSQEGSPIIQTLGGRTSTVPTFERRKIETQAMVPSGMTLVLGGLTEDSHFRTKTKVPLLGDIPGVGYAFRNDKKFRDKNQLLIFVTPTILSIEDYVASPEARDFLKQKPVDKPDVKWAPIDSAEPRDWTKPVE